MDKIEFATDSDIQRAHDLLLEGKPDFEQDKIKVIKCNESCDITACPGSGKTTTLLAKLLILAERMPFIDGSGICVITHTNVAINEIKSRFGRNTNALFSYPNYCGTIQSFIDQFLTIPWYNSFNEHPLVTVDDDRANAIIRRIFYSKGWDDQKKSSSLLHGNTAYQKACAVKDLSAVKQMVIGVIQSLFYDQATGRFYRKYQDGHVLAAYNEKAPSSDLFQILYDVRLEAYRRGILQYQDAYSTALNYLYSVQEIKQSLSERFSYVFIDEAQDSNQMQLDLIDRMFDLDKVVVQRFGDPYQSLYDDFEKPCAWVPRNPLQLIYSKRFGDAIAKVLQTVCIEDNTKLRGNTGVQSTKPVMIVYDDASNVLHSFVEILKTRKVNEDTVWEIAKRERSMDALHQQNIKAVGHVGNKEDEMENFTSIKQYFPEFESNRVLKYPFRPGMTLNMFLQKNSVVDSPSEYRNSIIDAFVAVLEIVDITNDEGRKFNKSSLLECYKNKHYSEYEILMNTLSNWVMEISSSELKVNPDVFDKVKSYITIDLASIFGFSDKVSILSNFLKKESDDYYEIEAEKQSTNIYKEEDIEIEVATVHSVKGETHAATLYLETKYYAYESEQFGNQLCGKVYKSRKGDSRIKARLKVAYVGMSRPKYLLAYAIKKERFQSIDCKELRDIWDVHEA